MHTVFFRIGWSKDWKTSTPWSLDLKPMPYIGYRHSSKEGVILYVFGPLAITTVNLEK